MAYSDYGAFVYCNGERRTDKEDVALFATDEETFGTDSSNIPSGARIWISLLKNKKDNKLSKWETSIHHGIMGDGNIRVMCHKCSIPDVYELLDTGEIKKIEQKDMENSMGEFDVFDFDCAFSYKGYSFCFRQMRPCFAQMIEPDGTTWTCEYGYEYGAGFDD